MKDRGEKKVSRPKSKRFGAPQATLVVISLLSPATALLEGHVEDQEVAPGGLRMRISARNGPLLGGFGHERPLKTSTSIHLASIFAAITSEMPSDLLGRAFGLLKPQGVR